MTPRSDTTDSSMDHADASGGRPARDGSPPELAELGLVPGEVVRWRDRPGGRWRQGTVTGRERDGSVGVRDGRGASRALTVGRLEVRGRGPRGAVAWEPLIERAARTEQMALWSPVPGAARARR